MFKWVCRVGHQCERSCVVVGLMTKWFDEGNDFFRSSTLAPVCAIIEYDGGVSSLTLVFGVVVCNCSSGVLNLKKNPPLFMGRGRRV